MPYKLIIGVFVLTMVFVIVGVDVAFFMDRPWPRLIANIGIVAALATF